MAFVAAIVRVEALPAVMVAGAAVTVTVGFALPVTVTIAVAVAGVLPAAPVAVAV